MSAMDFLRRSVGMKPSSRRPSNGLVRSFGGGRRVAPFEASANHPAVPNVPRIPPEGGIRYLREQQAIARHLVRNDAWIRSLVRVLKGLHIGTGPRPVSKFRELEELWQASCSGFSTTGSKSFGAMLRDDIYGNKIVDGEAFVRRRFRFDYPEVSRRLVVPIQFQTLTSDYVPVDHESFAFDDKRFAAGIMTDLDRPVAYAMHTEHPLSEGFRMRRPIVVPADEVFHLFDGPTGSPRGEVMLASAFLRAIAMSTLEDAERRRKQIASIMTVFFKRSDENLDDDMLPDAETVERMIGDVTFGTGVGHELPAGFDVETVQPKDEPMNFEKALRFQLLAISASVGAPVYEVTGDWRDAPERAMRIAAAAVSREAGIGRDGTEHQVLRPMFASWVDAAMASGMWTPPAGAKPWEIYDHGWDWPVIQHAALTQELKIMMDAADRGIVEPSYVSKSYFGKRSEEVARLSAKDYSRRRENGLLDADDKWDPTRTPTSQSIAKETADEEKHEREVVEAAKADTSVLELD
ncbi:capsid protein [Fulvimarina manganoxydans]|uniref:Capsid protein n=1 Tax=Fulvimarina manganoxydans TaxID=937218 RepID=A0A1W1Y8S5_9HYPH|nr:phage portal protein [Fulvimarina manganoxydans]SMC32562.1 capsid protein [Fulvimarina manganoxydans]